MNKDRYIYVVLVKGEKDISRTKWIRCAFNTRLHAAKWIKRMEDKDVSLTGMVVTEYKIKQVLLHSFGDPRLKKRNETF